MSKHKATVTLVPPEPTETVVKIEATLNLEGARELYSTLGNQSGSGGRYELYVALQEALFV